MGRLPAGFEPLEPFLEHWAVAGDAARAQARSAASAGEQARLYEAALPLMQPALAWLDGKPIAALDDADTRLMRLMLSLASVYHGIEVLKDAEPENARMRAWLCLRDVSPY